MSCRYLWLSQKGGSLIETLVVLGVMSVITAVLTSFLVSQQKEIKNLNQRAEIAEIKGFLITVLANPAVCSWQVKDKVINISGANPTKPSSSVVEFDTLYMGTVAGSMVLARKNEKLPGTQNNLEVESISIRNFTPTGTPNEVVGDLQIAFKPDTLVRAVKPLSVRQLFTLNGSDPLNGKRIVSCGPPAPEGEDPGADTVMVVGPESPCRGPSVVDCPSGTKLVTGGHQWIRSCGCKEQYRFTTVSKPRANGWESIIECSTNRAHALCRKISP